MYWRGWKGEGLGQSRRLPRFSKVVILEAADKRLYFFGDLFELLLTFFAAGFACSNHVRLQQCAEFAFGALPRLIP